MFCRKQPILSTLQWPSHNNCQLHCLPLTGIKMVGNMPRSMALWICITENLIEAATMWSMWLLSGHFMKRQTEGKGLWLVKNNTWQSKELWALLLLYKPVKSTPAPSSCDVVQIHYTITFHPFFLVHYCSDCPLVIGVSFTALIFALEVQVINY